MGYEFGKIYRLECVDGHFYIGSTIQTLSMRLGLHRFVSKKGKTKNSRVYTHINQIGWDNVKIVLIQEYPCKSKRELEAKEQEFIKTDNPLCLNTMKSFITADDKLRWRADHHSRRIREEHNAYNNANYHKHKDEINARRRDKRRSKKVTDVSNAS